MYPTLPRQDVHSTKRGLFGQQEGGASLAGNYGGIARRGSRGIRASQTISQTSSEQSVMELLDKRLVQVEQELINTKTDVKDLRKIVEALQLQQS